MKLPRLPFSLTQAGDKLGAKLTVGGGWVLLGLAFLITFEIIARKFFKFSTQGADEIGGYVLAITSTIGFSYALIRKAHIRMDALANRFPLGGRVGLDILAFAALNLFIWLLSWRAFEVLQRSYELKAVAPTPLGTPLIIPQTLWVLGLFLFGLLAFTRFATAIYQLTRGRPEQATIELGVSLLKEELVHEMADAKRRVGAAESPSEYESH